jgi:hypothetical protein
LNIKCFFNVKHTSLVYKATRFYEVGISEVNLSVALFIGDAAASLILNENTQAIKVNAVSQILLNKD